MINALACVVRGRQFKKTKHRSGSITFQQDDVYLTVSRAMELQSGEELLSVPTAAAEDFTKPFKRKSSLYENKCSRFMMGEREYTNQYSHIYFMRLNLMKTRVQSVAKRTWGEWEVQMCRAVVGVKVLLHGLTQISNAHPNVAVHQLPWSI